MSITKLLISFFWVPYESGFRFGEPGYSDAYRRYITDAYHLKDILVWSIVVALTQFILLINQKFGHGVLWDIIRGKYHLPRQETRIFMFADLNDSTSLAEKLGDEQYHELLKDFFADITNPVIDNYGEIYQYIGDEVVIAWKYQSGIERNHCLRCFFDIKQCIERNKNQYILKYGMVPEFKAGLHYGKVVAGEVGIIKRDITYSGDVLNTTSRIENKCKEFDADILVSDDLLSQLSFDGQFSATALGRFKLRGKEKEIALSSLSERG
jgi:adenylate cyclase